MKRKEYHCIFVTNLPAFYKINLYNCIERELGKSGRHMLAVFTEHTSSDRNADFTCGAMDFEHVFLHGGRLRRSIELIALLRHARYGRLILGGWDSAEAWAAALLMSRKRNCLVVESSAYESATTGLKGLAKRIFVSRIGDTAYVPGVSNARLVRSLGFKGQIVRTHGVGVFNYVAQPPYEQRKEVRRFLYVGRLVEVKNLKMLIRVFNSLPRLRLTIVGFGEQEAELRAMAGENIAFAGAIGNKQLPQVYQQHDVFVLPSAAEPWGLVVEEALNNGLPVIVSDRVGCHEEIVNASNGIVFAPANSEAALRQAVVRMTDADFCNSLRKNIAATDFASTERKQVECYL